MLYSLKNAGALFRVHLAQYMQEFWYKSWDADLYLSMKPELRAEDKLECYSFILFYVDGILCIHHDHDNVLNKMNGYVPLKPGSVRNSTMYLSTKCQHMQLDYGIWAWSLSLSKYV